MPVLNSTLDTSGEKFSSNRQAMEGLLEELSEKTATAAKGGSERARTRHTERGKLLPRSV